MKEHRVLLGIAVFALVAIAGCATPAYFPDGEWRRSLPEEQGVDSQGIANLIQKIDKHGLPVHSLLLIRNGYLITEAYFAPVASDNKHYLHSCTKSVTSALMGIAIQEGLIKGVDQKVLDYFPEIKNRYLDQYWRDLTIENLLTMATGQDSTIAPNPYEVADWVERFFALPISQPPGTTFKYNSGGPEVLSVILWKVSGKTTLEYAREKLFGPMGITDVYWAADSWGNNLGNGYLALKPTDLAKFGYLYLNGGVWNGRQVVPREWVEKSTQKHIETRGKMNSAEDDGYGYFWWANGFGGYSAHGMGGQFVFVVPEYNLVAVFTGGFADPQFPTDYALMKTDILPAVKSNRPLAGNDPAVQALTESVKRVANPPSGNQAVALPDTARRVSGKTFKLGSNGFNAKSVTIYFENNAEFRAVIIFSYQGQEDRFEFTGGLDGGYRVGKNMDSRLPTLSGYKGVWQDDHTFIVYEDPVSDVAKGIYKFDFDGDFVFIQLSAGLSGAVRHVQSAVGELQK